MGRRAVIAGRAGERARVVQDCVQEGSAQGIAGGVQQGQAGMQVNLVLGSRQKSRLLPAGDEVMSEKSASATFFQFI
jgi:hypothetical protein